MKKSALLIIAFFSFSFLNAQLPFSFGPKVGFTTSKLSTDENEISEEFKANFQGGVFVRLGNKTYLQPEVNFITKGGLFGKDEILGVKEIGLTTVEIPILLGAHVLDLKFANLRFMAGPTMAFVIDKKIRMGDDPNLPPIKKEMIKDAVWGMQAGVGIDVLMFALDVRYELGLNNIIDYQDYKMKNSLWNISLGWKIL